MEWTEEAIARLRGLWAEGHSTAEIGRRMGISKNAVVGKAHRLELPPRPSPIRREGLSTRPPRRPLPRRISGPTLPSMAGPLTAAAPVAPAGGLAMSAPPPVPGPAQPPRMAVAAALRPSPATAASPVPEPVAEPRMTPRPVPVAAPRVGGRCLPCCWPIGEPGTAGFRFCDGDALPGKPYCGDHAALAYVKVRDRRDEAA